jgi:hypothetical protein
LSKLSVMIAIHPLFEQVYKLGNVAPGLEPTN